jgi:hypothetical protein
MKKTTRTLLAFHEQQLDSVSKLKEAFAGAEMKEISNRELFLIGMAIGFASKNKIVDFKRSNTGVRMEYFKDEDNVLFAALQVCETGKPEALLDIESLYDLAEQYASGGIAILAEYLNSEKNFQEWFHGFIYENLVMQESV